MKVLRVNKIFKESKFKGVWGQLKSRKGFQRESLTKYVRITLVFMRNGAYGKNLVSIFQEFFVSINEIFILARRLGARI